MTHIRTTLGTGLAAAGALAVAAALAISTAGPSHAGEAHKVRHETMKTLGGGMKKLGAAVAAGEMTEVAALATDIAEAADQIPAKFEERDIPEESRAKPEIWDNFDDFTAKAEALEEAAMKVASQAEAGTLPNDPKAVAGMIGGACGACHKQYRGPEKN